MFQSRPTCFESCAFPNLGYEVERELGPGEIVLVTPEGVTQERKQARTFIGLPEEKLCTFCWSGHDPTGQFPGLSGSK